MNSEMDGMEKTDSEEKHASKGLIIAAAIVVVVAAAILIALSAVNAGIEKNLGRTIDTAISENGLSEFVKYEDIKANAAAGKFVIEGITLGEASGAVTYRAKSLTVSVSPAEAARFALNPETAVLTNFDALAKNISMTDSVSGSSMAVREMSVDAEGSFSMDTAGNPESAELTEITVKARDFSGDAKASGLQGTFGTLDCSVSGDMSPATFNGGFMKMISGISTLDLHVSKAAMTPPALFVQNLEPAMDSAAWMTDPANWVIDELDVESSSGQGSLSVGKFSIATPLITAEGTGSAALGAVTGVPNAPLKMDASLKVAKLESGFREFLIPVMAMMGVGVPEEGPFTVTVRSDESGSPTFSIE